MITNNLDLFDINMLSDAFRTIELYSKNEYDHAFWADNEVQLFGNTYSKHIFLTDINGQFLVLNENKDGLEGFYISPETGVEGTLSDLIKMQEAGQLDEYELTWLTTIKAQLNALQ